jgi:hypothetical protein
LALGRRPRSVIALTNSNYPALDVGNVERDVT